MNRCVRPFLFYGFLAFNILVSGCLQKDTEPASPRYSNPFNQFVQQSSVTDDRDGRTYNTVTINNQSWFAENLAYIPFIANSKRKGIWVYDFGDTSLLGAKASGFYIRYGCLYDWKLAENACPAGWHLPTEADWENLLDYIQQNGHPFDEGTALKSTSGWMGGAGDTKGNGTDVYKFTALPAGMRIPGGNYYYIGGRTEFWTSTPRDSVYYWAYDLKHTTGSILKYAQTGNYGLSVRCIKD